MATINQRTLADGRARYWVKWRLGGTRGGAPQSEPFDTRADYHRELELHLIPHFGQVNLRDVTQLKPKGVRAWVNRLRTGTPDPKASYRTPNPSRGRQKEPGWLRKPLTATNRSRVFRRPAGFARIGRRRHGPSTRRPTLG